jgi:hypothetical protein
MSDIEEPDDEDVDTFVQEHTAEIEVDMLTALARDFEQITGEPVTITSYVAVAEFINEAGEVDMMWTTPDRMSPQAMLGHAHWLLKRVDEVT